MMTAPIDNGQGLNGWEGHNDTDKSRGWAMEPIPWYRKFFFFLKTLCWQHVNFCGSNPPLGCLNTSWHIGFRIFDVLRCLSTPWHVDFLVFDTPAWVKGWALEPIPNIICIYFQNTSHLLTKHLHLQAISRCHTHEQAPPPEPWPPLLTSLRRSLGPLVSNTYHHPQPSHNNGTKARQYDSDDKESMTMAEWPSNANECPRSQTTNREGL